MAEDETLDSIINSLDMYLSTVREIAEDREACSSWGRKELDDLVPEQQQQWTHCCFRL